MKILNAIHAQFIGGVDQVFRNYTEVLEKQGHEVALLISNNGNNNYKNTKIFKLKNLSQISDFLHLLFITIKFQPDVILCHSNRLMKWMRILKFFSKAKSVAINHGISFKSSLHCNYIININKEISNLVVNVGFDQKKSFIIPNVIKIDQKFQKKTLNKPLIIGMYGRIEPRKGFDILIKAAEILQKKNIDFRLKIGGFEVPGSYNWQHLHKLTKEHNIFEKCHFVGTVLDKKEFFKDVDIFCVPSREEPFGLVILEGFLYSTLVISSNTDGGRFLIKDEEDGFLFKNEDEVDLAKKIENILHHPDIYAKIAQNAFLKLEKNFSLDFLTKEITKVFEKINF